MSAIPILRKVYPFTATENHIFYFDVYGTANQVIYNELEIRDITDTSIVIYKTKIQEFRYQHDLPRNTLTNGVQYVAILRTYDINQILIGESEPIFFYCFSCPQLTIPTIVNSQVNNQTVIFQGVYNQLENELLQSYIFILYDENKIEVAKSPTLYNVSNIQYEFTLENNRTYHIEFKVSTVNEMEHSTGLILFTAKYIAPRFSSALTLENLSDEASVKISCNVLQIIGKPLIEPVTYIGNEMVDLRNNVVCFDDGFRVKGNHDLRLWIKDIVPSLPFYTYYSGDGSFVELKFINNRIHLYKYLNEKYILQHIISDEVMNLDDNILFICIQYINGLFDIFTEVIV